MKVQFIAVSQNAKTAPIPASIVERTSCWPGCALYENGCYAETGALAMHWDRVSRGLAGGSWSEFCAKVASLCPGRLWRYAQAGDLPGYGPQIDGTLLEELVAANTGKNVIAFTHKPVLADDPVAAANRRLIAGAVKAGFTINLSADNPARADRLAKLGITPVVTVLARVHARGAVRHRFKRRPDQWPRRSASGITARLPWRGTRPRKARSNLPRDLHRRNLQDLPRLRPSPGCRNRLSGPWRLAASRGRDGRPRCPSWRKLGFPRPSHDGRSARRGSNRSLRLHPPDQPVWRGRGVRTSRSSGRRTTDNDNSPCSAACPVGFCVLGSYLPRISGDDSTADSLNDKLKGRDVPIPDIGCQPESKPVRSKRL
jgi:hypothetical protein